MPLTYLLSFAVWAAIIGALVLSFVGGGGLRVHAPLVLLGALALATATEFASLVVRPVRPLVVLLIHWVLVFSTLMTIGSISVGRRESTVTPPGTVPLETILPGDDESVLVFGQEGFALRGLVVRRNHDEPRLAYYDLGWWDREAEQIVAMDGTAISAQGLLGVETMPPPASLESLVDHAEQVVATLVTAYETPVAWDGGAVTAALPFLRRLVVTWGTLIAVSAVLALVLTMAWTPSRLTRWPLFNFFLAFVVIRGIVAVPHLASLPQVTRLAGGAGIESLIGIQLILWGGAAAILIVIAAILPPLKRWQREIGSVG